MLAYIASALAEADNRLLTLLSGSFALASPFLLKVSEYAKAQSDAATDKLNELDKAEGVGGAPFVPISMLRHLPVALAEPSDEPAATSLAASAGESLLPAATAPQQC